MYVCMYVCMYMHIYLIIDSHMYRYRYACNRQKRIHTLMCVVGCANCALVQVRMCVYVWVHVWMDVCSASAHSILNPDENLKP